MVSNRYFLRHCIIVSNYSIVTTLILSCPSIKICHMMYSDGKHICLQYNTLIFRHDTLTGIVCVAAVHQLWRSANITPTFGTNTPNIAVIRDCVCLWIPQGGVMDNSTQKQANSMGRISCIQANK